MPVTITVPRLGWSMDEGIFIRWLKKDGEFVKAGEPLFTLEGDKASQEIEALESGILRIPESAPRPGETVSVGVVLGYLVGENESPVPTARIEAPKLDEKQATIIAPEVMAVISGRPHPPSQREPAPTIGRIRISPRARRRGAELGVDYYGLKGSGRTGRITEADVLEAAKKSSLTGLSRMRRSIAHRTADSFAKVPHFYLHTEVDATAFMGLRERLLPQIQKATGVRLTLTDLLLRAQALALRDCSFANVIWQENNLVQLSACDVGVVVSLDHGLALPIIRKADRGGLAELIRQRQMLVEGARAGKLTADALEGGATSLSNLGNTCVDEFQAVIAAPQSSMLAAGRAAPRPFAVHDQVAIRTTLKLCLSVDHRVMDGAPAAKFLDRIVELIEHPSELCGD